MASVLREAKAGKPVCGWQLVFRFSLDCKGYRNHSEMRWTLRSNLFRRRCRPRLIEICDSGTMKHSAMLWCHGPEMLCLAGPLGGLSDATPLRCRVSSPSQTSRRPRPPYRDKCTAVYKSRDRVCFIQRASDHYKTTYSW